MSFFQSDIVRAEMAEISELQEEVYANDMKFAYMDDEDKVYHILPNFPSLCYHPNTFLILEGVLYYNQILHQPYYL